MRADTIADVIRVGVGGGMGNQMFQLAFAEAASRRLGTTYILGHLRIRNRKALGTPLWRHFEIGDWSRRSTRLSRRLEFLRRHGRRPDIVAVGQHDDPASVSMRLRDGAAYNGFFQSEQWFSGFESQIRSIFTPRQKFEEEFAKRYDALGPYICMHVRRGDYLETGVWALPTSYFRDALDKIPDRDRYQLIVVSDEPAVVRDELGDLDGFRCEANHPMIDLLLLMNARVVVTSNSSFSWWGAWLNRVPEVTVIAPEHWLGFASGVEEPRGVVPSGWQTVTVTDKPLTSAGT